MITLVRTFIIRFALTGITALFLIPSALGQATDSPASTTQVEISFEHGDLVDPVRLSRLVERIEAAAMRVCREELLDDLLRPVTLRACIRDATNRAMDALETHKRTALTVASNESVGQR